MILSDQPDCFPPDVAVFVSARDDGTMLDRTVGDRHASYAVEHRGAFCDKAGIDYDDCVYQIISYGSGETYDAIQRVDTPNTVGVHADMLYTETSKLGLFLPVADCIGTVVYDPTRRALGLAHIGRHASIANTLAKAIAYFSHLGSDPGDLLIWMAPSIHQEHYRMEYFDAAQELAWQGFCLPKNGGYYLDLQGYNRQLAITSGVLPKHIIISSIDTATNPHYFSHSQGDVADRFAVVAMLR